MGARALFDVADSHCRTDRCATCRTPRLRTAPTSAPAPRERSTSKASSHKPWARYARPYASRLLPLWGKTRGGVGTRGRRRRHRPHLGLFARGALSRNAATRVAVGIEPISTLGTAGATKPCDRACCADPFAQRGGFAPFAQPSLESVPPLQSAFTAPNSR